MSTKDQLNRESTSAQNKLNEAGEEVKARAREAASKAQETAASYVDQGKETAATSLTDFAKAVRSASDELSQRDQGMAARFVTEAADGLEKIASNVHGTSVDEMMSSVQSFAKRNPAAFVAGAVLAGVALGRFAKASSERHHDGGTSGSFGGSSTGSESYRSASIGTSSGRVGPSSSAPLTGTPSRPSTTMSPTSGTTGSTGKL